MNVAPEAGLLAFKPNGVVQPVLDVRPESDYPHIGYLHMESTRAVLVAIL